MFNSTSLFLNLGNFKICELKLSEFQELWVLKSTYLNATKLEKHCFIIQGIFKNLKQVS